MNYLLASKGFGNCFVNCNQARAKRAQLRVAQRMKGFTRSRTKLSDSDKNLMPFRAFVCSCRKSLVYLSFSAPTFVCPSGKVCPSNIVKVRNSSPVFRAHHDLRVYEEFLLELHLVISLRSSKLVTKLFAHTHRIFDEK